VIQTTRKVTVLRERNARKRAEITQGAAAERLHISVRTLQRYESGKRKIPADIREGMAALYRAPWLQEPRFIELIWDEPCPPDKRIHLIKPTLKKGA